MLVFDSSIISKTYCEVLTTSAGMLKVADNALAGMLEARVYPEVGVTPAPCCSLMVTVPLDGFVQRMVFEPVEIWRPPLGIVMAFC